MADARCIFVSHLAYCQGRVWLSLFLWQCWAMMGTMVEVKCMMRMKASFETQCMKELYPGESWRELAALNRKVMH